MNFLNAIFARLAAFVPAAVSNKIGADKVLHFCGGLFFGAIAGAAAMFLGGAAWWCVAVAALAGVTKEALDAFKNHQAEAAGLPAPHSVDFFDAVWTTAGGLVPAAIFVLLSKLPAGVMIIDTMMVSA